VLRLVAISLWAKVEILMLQSVTFNPLRLLFIPLRDSTTVATAVVGLSVDHRAGHWVGRCISHQVGRCVARCAARLGLELMLKLDDATVLLVQSIVHGGHLLGKVFAIGKDLITKLAEIENRLKRPLVEVLQRLDVHLEGHAIENRSVCAYVRHAIRVCMWARACKRMYVCV
jgi:hypothetical protein